MLTTAVIAFREFLEAFLIVGVFVGISRRLKLKREKEIIIAATVGFVISLLLSTLTFTFTDLAQKIFTPEKSEMLESLLLIFSGFFITYVVFSIHDFMGKGRNKAIIIAQKKLRTKSFDLSLFATITFLILREGFEIALFTASTSFFSVFFQNFLGLIIGFISASLVGLLTFLAYTKFSVNKVFKITEYMIILLGASLMQNGITEFLEHVFNLHLSEIFPLPLSFLPSEESIQGHLLQSFLGVDREFSFVRLTIMVVYIGIIYMVFKRKKLTSIR